MAIDVITLRAAKKYIEESLKGLGALKGEDGVTYKPSVGTVEVVGESDVAVTIDIDEDNKKAIFNFKLPYADLSKIDDKIDKPASATDGQVLTYRNNEWVADDSQGGSQFAIIAKTKKYEGQTVTATKGTKSKSAVITSGVARIPVDEGGIWTLTLSSGETWNTPNMTYYGEYEVLLAPNGATVTPTDDIQTWLKCAELNESYTSISQVLADTDTLSALISDNNAVDYMVRSTTWASDVCNNESAMTYIGLNDYCANKLLVDSTWCTAICDSPYSKKVLNVKVPTMISNTAPSGEVFGKGSLNNGDYWQAFNPNNFCSFQSTSASSVSVGYKFANPTKVAVFSIYNDSTHWSNGTGVKKAKLQGYKSNLGWIDLTDVLTFASGDNTKNIASDKIGTYEKYQLVITSNTSSFSQHSTNVKKLQFYGREEA